jgi:hypothetical protein
MCPYYAGPVYFAVANLANVRKGDDVDAADYNEQMVVVANSFFWLTQQPSSRPHWHIQGGLLLCTLTDN